MPTNGHPSSALSISSQSFLTPAYPVHPMVLVSRGVLRDHAPRRGRNLTGMSYDLVIRNGTIVDGLGSEPYRGDVAVSDGIIVAIGTVNETGRREIDADGLLVTPGFVDLHTHYDGQAIWSERMSPSSSHGVTTAVMGNCGVGFAPCRPEDHDVLVDVMAGVEDIPGVVMTDGLPWDWETFPQYLDALDGRRRDIVRCRQQA